DPYDWPAMRSLLQKHFIWPVDGHLSATQVARCLGVTDNFPPRVSLYHDDAYVAPDVYKRIWSWYNHHVRSLRKLPPPQGLIDTYLSMHRQEREARTLAMSVFRKQSLSERVEQFRAIGPLTFLYFALEDGEVCYVFSFDSKMPTAKFRVGDF